MGIEKYFKYEHLPPFLQVVSKPFSEAIENLSFESVLKLRYTANEFIVNDRAEHAQCLQKLSEAYDLLRIDCPEAAKRLLLEAKDCAVRAALP